MSYRFLLPLGALALLGGGMYLLDARATEKETAYHQVPSAQYAVLVEETIRTLQPANKIPLSRVEGGVVPHHVPTTIPLLVEFYHQLKEARSVDTFVIIGPDHVDAGSADITVSKARFVTPLGTLYPDLEIIAALEGAGNVKQDEAPFDDEHSITSQLLIIARTFPDAKIVPIILRTNTPTSVARTLGRELAKVTNEKTFFIASVDFSHYFAEPQARALDAHSADLLKDISVAAAPLVEADSPQSITALAAIMEARNATTSAMLKTLNTADLTQNRDFTTGYIIGFFGQ